MNAELRYGVSIRWSAEDEAFLAAAPDLPGCITDGATHQEALTNALEAIEGWLETAREQGCPIPAPSERTR